MGEVNIDSEVLPMADFGKMTWVRVGLMAEVDLRVEGHSRSVEVVWVRRIHRIESDEGEGLDLTGGDHHDLAGLAVETVAEKYRRPDKTRVMSSSSSMIGFVNVDD